MTTLKKLFKTMQEDVLESGHLSDGYLKLLEERKSEYEHHKNSCNVFNLNGKCDCKEEPKSTLREDIKEILCEAMYLKPEYLDPTGNKDTDKIISLFKDTLLKEIEKVRNNYVMYEIEPYEKDIINLIKNL